MIDAGAARFGIDRTQPAPGTRALADIRAVAGRILAYASPDEFERVVSPDMLTAYRDLTAQSNPRFGRPRAEDRPGLAAPVHAATAAVGVTAALSILGASDIASAGDAMRWLVTGASNYSASPTATVSRSHGSLAHSRGV